ncbi:MAG TPA: ribonuclease III domain-containing protein [Solirubrobacteraceae bacterium]|nr:ribonuclease III domain-containing protein [Solirubrobacteraceae bacterium]
MSAQLLEHDAPGAGGMGGAKLIALAGELPSDLARQVFTHASWSEHRSGSYERLAFLGDSVLGLAITAHLYPRLAAERFGAGRLTKIRAQVVSGPSCRLVAQRLGLLERLQGAAPQSSGPQQMRDLATERVLASVLEALIGACFLQVGYERSAAAVVDAFAPEIERALQFPLDFKSTLQEQLARSGERAAYELIDERGPPHRRTFAVGVRLRGELVGRGEGPSKKVAEQEAARQALERLGEG